MIFITSRYLDLIMCTLSVFYYVIILLVDLVHVR